MWAISRQIDVGDFLDGGEALGHEQLGDDLVDVERIHEDLRALGEFLLPALGLSPAPSGCRCPSP